MLADLIIKNAKIYTVNTKQPWADTLVVKDGKFVYVGNEAGASEYDGPTEDAGEKLILPGLIEGHTHVGYAARGTVAAPAVKLASEGKAAILEEVRASIDGNPGQKEYNFNLSVNNLHGETIKFEELDAINDEVPIRIMESEQHSMWVNTKKFKTLGVNDYAPDISPGYSVYERDPDGRINGRIYEMCTLPDFPEPIDEEVYYKSLDMIMDFCRQQGIVAMFDAGVPSGSFENAEQFYKCVSEYDKQGKMPIYMEAGLHLVKPRQLDTAIETLREFDRKYSTGNFKIRTMKSQTDGTFNGRTACVTVPYLDNGKSGGMLVPPERLEEFMLELNEAGIDFHLHSVGDQTVRSILDCVEHCKKKLGDKFKIQVSVAHVELTPDEDLGRFAELGVIVNYTPFWFGGICISGGIQAAEAYLGKERTRKMYRANSVWNTGAIVNFSSDNVTFAMPFWSPYLGMEVGITRQFNESGFAGDYSKCPVYPCDEEKLSMAQMIRGYTINNAIMLKLDDRIGSIEPGKDASFNIYKENLFEVDPQEIHNQLPEAVYFRGKKQ